MGRSVSLVFKLVRSLLMLAALLAAIGLGVVWYIGAWNLVFPNSDHDTVAPELPADLQSPSILVFTKTNGFRHRDGIEGGVRAVWSLATAHQWDVFHTENGAVFNAADLARFDVVVFLNASGDMLNEAQESAFQDWWLAGGGWLGVHAAGDSSHLAWQWYRDNLIGADFTAHIMDPQFQTATVVLENQGHPVLEGIPDIWEHEEEWYSWEKSPRFEGFTILATVDEESYSPVMRFMGEVRNLSMGDHPVVWSNCQGEGRSVYMTMGHREEAFDQPQVYKLMENSILWFLDQEAGGCPGDETFTGL